MLLTSFQIFNRGNCIIPSGCPLIFDKKDRNSVAQYIPSNTLNYIVVLEGSATTEYSDWRTNTHSFIYNSSSWLEYQDVWRYDTSVNFLLNESNTTVARIKLLNNSNSSIFTSDCTLKIRKIENETVEINTDKESNLYVYGYNFSYNGVAINSSRPVYGYNNKQNNSTTHLIVATTPLKLLFLEKK